MSACMILSAVLISLGGLCSLTRQAQMLQQNSYFPSRYLNWLKGERSPKVFVSAFSLILTVLLILLKSDILCLIFSALSFLIRLYYAYLGQKKSIKKLVFTARVKRQYVAAVLLFALLTVLGAVLKLRALFLAATVLSYIPALTILLVRFFNSPAENAVSRWYVNDAKRMLREHSNLTVIGVTGSYGKTSTKYVLETFLSQKYNILITPQSFNTPMGIVRTVRGSLRPETQVFIAEMGAKKIGDIKEICDIANPQMGVITSVGPQHLDTFHSIENVVKTKFELADHVLRSGGTVFLNTDNELIAEKARLMSSVSYGKSGDVSYKNVRYSENGMSFDIAYKNGEIHIVTKLLGLHNVMNITAAAAVALKLFVAPRDIAFAATKLRPVEHRLQMKSFIGGSIMLDDAYNANPVGSLEACRVLSQFEGKKKIVITPGLVELGEKEYECNFELGRAAAKAADILVFVGKVRSKPLKEGAEKEGFSGEMHIVGSFKEALSAVSGALNRDTVVLVENDLPDNYLK